MYRGHGTPLHAAAFNGRHSVAELLLEKGAQVDIQDANCHDLRAKTANTIFSNRMLRDETSCISIIFNYGKES